MVVGYLGMSESVSDLMLAIYMLPSTSRPLKASYSFRGKVGAMYRNVE